MVHSIWRVAIALLLIVGVAMWMARHDESEFDRLTARLSKLHDDTQRAYHQDTSAECIRKHILPSYGQAIDEFQAVVLESDGDGMLKASMLDYLATMQVAWRLMAEAIDDRNIITQGRAVEQHERAREILISMGVEVQNLPPHSHSEIALLLLADQRLDAVLSDIVESEISEAELANAVEKDVLPEWERSVQRFTEAMESPPEEYRRSVDRLSAYAEVRSRAIRLQVAGLRESDEAKSQEAAEQFREARQLQAEIMEAGLIEE